MSNSIQVQKAQGQEECVIVASLEIKETSAERSSSTSFCDCTSDSVQIDMDSDEPACSELGVHHKDGSKTNVTLLTRTSARRRRKRSISDQSLPDNGIESKFFNSVKLSAKLRPLNHSNAPFVKLTNENGNKLFGHVHGTELFVQDMKSIFPKTSLNPKLVDAVMKILMQQYHPPFINNSTVLEDLFDREAEGQRSELVVFSMEYPELVPLHSDIRSPDLTNNAILEDNGQVQRIFVLPVKLPSTKFILLLANPVRGMVVVYDPVCRREYLSCSTDPTTVFYIKDFQRKMAKFYNHSKKFWCNHQNGKERNAWKCLSGVEAMMPVECDLIDSGVCIIIFIENILLKPSEWKPQKKRTITEKRMDLIRASYFRILDRSNIEPPLEASPTSSFFVALNLKECGTNTDLLAIDLDDFTNKLAIHDCFEENLNCADSQRIWGYFDHSTHGRTFLSYADIESLQEHNCLNSNIIDAKLLVLQASSQIKFAYISTRMTRHILYYHGVNLNSSFGLLIRDEIRQMRDNKILAFCININGTETTDYNAWSQKTNTDYNWNIVTANYVTKTISIFDPFQEDGQVLPLGFVSPNRCWTNPVSNLQCIQAAIVQSLEEESYDEWNGTIGTYWPIGLKYETLELATPVHYDVHNYGLIACLYVEGLVWEDFNYDVINDLCDTDITRRCSSSFQTRKRFLREIEQEFHKKK